MGDPRRDQKPAGDAGRLTLRPALAALAAGALVLAAGCGSSTHATAPPPPPKLPRTLAQQLAARSDAVAAALARGDSCGAQSAARELRADATASIGRVPARLQEPLSSGVNALVASLPVCVVKTKPEPARKPHPDHGHHGRKHKHGGDEGKGG